MRYVLAGLGFPVGRESLVEGFVEFAGRIVGNVEQARRHRRRSQPGSMTRLRLRRPACGSVNICKFMRIAPELQCVIMLIYLVNKINKEIVRNAHRRRANPSSLKLLWCSDRRRRPLPGAFTREPRRHWCSAYISGSHSALAKRLAFEHVEHLAIDLGKDPPEVASRFVGAIVAAPIGRLGQAWQWCKRPVQQAQAPQRVVICEGSRSRK